MVTNIYNTHMSQITHKFKFIWKFLPCKTYNKFLIQSKQWKVSIKSHIQIKSIQIFSKQDMETGVQLERQLYSINSAQSSFC